MTGIVRELVNRGVARVAAAYIAIVWLILQVIDVLSGIVMLPDWFGMFVLVAGAMGLPVAVLLSWNYDIAEDGSVVRAEYESPEVHSTKFGRSGVDYVIIGALVLVVAGQFVERRLNPAADLDPLRVENYRILTDDRIFIPPASSPFPFAVDHSRVFFVDTHNNHLRISQVPQSGGQSTVFSDIDYDAQSYVVLFGMSPALDEILYTTVDIVDLQQEAKTWRQPLTGGDRKFVTEAYQGAISPDDTELAYRQGFSDVRLMNLVTGESEDLATLPGVVYWIRYRPSGNTLRLTSYREMFVGSLYEVDLKTGATTELFPDAPFTAACCGSWSPDGRFYAFQATDDEGEQLWAVDLNDGTDAIPFRLTGGSLEHIRPIFSPDGRTLFAAAWHRQGEVREFIPEVEATRPPLGLRDESVEQVVYSNLRDQVAFVSYPEGHLWVKPVNSERKTQLTSGENVVSRPQWSPDGERLVFEYRAPGSTKQVAIARADGSQLQVIETDNYKYRPNWLRSGEEIIYTEAGKSLPQVFDVQSGETRELETEQEMRGATYSPDGKMLFGQSDEGFFILQVDSGEYSELPPSGRGFNDFYWASDNSGIYFIDGILHLSDRSVWFYELETNEFHKVAHMGEQYLTWGKNARWIGVSPDGNPMYLDNESVHDIVALELNDYASE